MSIEVSVVIPVYNGEKTLSACIESVLDQTFKDYEVIFVNNNSTDRTAEILKKYPVRAVFEAVRIRGTARDTGIKSANGKIIVCTDADCIFEKDWLEKLTKPLIEEREVASQGSEKPVFLNFWTKAQQLKSENHFNKIIEKGYVECVDTKNFAIQKDVLAKIGNFNKNIHVAEDMDLCLRLFLNGYKIKFSNAVVMHFHRDNLIKIMENEFQKGLWSTKIKKQYPHIKHPLFEAESVFGFVKFIPGLIYFFLNGKYSFSQAIFEFLTGVAWRAGVVSSWFKWS